MFRDPVLLVDSCQTYDRQAIEKHLRRKNVDPLTNLPVSNDLVPNISIRNGVEAWLSDNPGRTPNAHIRDMCVEKGIEVNVDDPKVFFKIEEVENTCASHLRKLENYYTFVTSFESHGRELGPREIKDEGTDEDGAIVVHQDSSMTLTRGKMMPDHWSFLKAAGNRDVGLNYCDKAAGVNISSTRKSDKPLKYKYIELLCKLEGKNIEILDILVEKNIISQEEKAGSIAGITSGKDISNWYYKVFPKDIVVVHQDSSMTLTRDKFDYRDPRPNQ